jgi:hypothetical protein
MFKVPLKYEIKFKPWASKNGYCNAIVPSGKRESEFLPDATPCPLQIIPTAELIIEKIFTYGQKHLKKRLPVPLGPIRTLIGCIHLGQ